MDTSRKVEDIVDAAAEELGHDYARAISWLRRRRTIEVLTRLIAERKYEALLDADGIERVADVLSRVKGKAHQAAGKSVADYIAGRLDQPVNYDRVNALAVARTEQNRLAMVRSITAEQRQVVSQILIEGSRQGLNPKTKARDIKGSIGLTPHQQEIVQNYRTSLETNSQDALDRKLRDARFDGAIEAAIENDKKLPKAKVDQMVAAYERKFIAHRAESIARTEALRSAHQGAQDNWNSAVQQGTIDQTEVERTWRHGPKRKYSRDSHVKMSGQKRRLGEPFIADDGTELMYPCDPSAPAKHTIRCTCAVVTRLR